MLHNANIYSKSKGDNGLFLYMKMLNTFEKTKTNWTANSRTSGTIF